MISQKFWVQLSLVYLLFVASAGLLLRSSAVADLFTNYKYLLHAHSHVAMLGWIFNVFFLGVTREFLQTKWLQIGCNKLLFWLLQISIFGMLVSFSIQGYGLWSIAFSSLHIFLSYWLILTWAREIKLFRSRDLPEMALLGALFFLLLSTLGPWALSVFSAVGLKGSSIYQAAIYWFLHFTYNGWMTLGLMAIWLKFLSNQKMLKSSSVSLSGFFILFASTIGGFILSLYGFQLDLIWHVLGILFALSQLMGVYLIIVDVKWSNLKQHVQRPGITASLVIVGSVAWVMKVIFQVLSAIPSFLSISFFNRDLLILYLHLVLVGFVTLWCVAYLAKSGFLAKGFTFAFSSGLFVIGFFVQECILGLKGLGVVIVSTSFWNVSLVITAAIMLVGVLGFFVTTFLKVLR